MKKRYTKILFVVIMIFLLIGMAIWVLFLNRGENGDREESQYTYTVYEDHVVLEKYLGNEEIVYIPETLEGKSVTEIGYKCFDSNETIKVVVLTSSVEHIGKSAFDNCTNLVEVYGGENIKVIDVFAFVNCKKLERVEVGDKLEWIDFEAFRRCESLKSMDKQENILYIGDYAFYQSGIEIFAFNRDAKIGYDPFGNTKWIQNQPEEFVICGEGNLIGYNGTEKEVVIPNGVETLNYGSFRGMMDSDIYIPETVHTIHGFAFVDCINVNVYIPESVELMGDEEGDYPIKNSEDKVTIYTTFQSYAHLYALENGIPFEVLGKNEFESLMQQKIDGE